MSYAKLANLPVQYGLYTSVFCPLIYMLFGTCSNLVLGTAAVEDQIVGNVVADSIGYDSMPHKTKAQKALRTELVINATLVFSIMIGVVQLVLRVANLGRVSI